MTKGHYETTDLAAQRDALNTATDAKTWVANVLMDIERDLDCMDLTDDAHDELQSLFSDRVEDMGSDLGLGSYSATMDAFEDHLLYSA